MEASGSPSTSTGVSQQDMSPLKSSRIASQVDPSVSPKIHFVPLSGKMPESYRYSSQDFVYRDLFEKIAECQSTSNDRIPSSLLHSYRSLPLHEQLTNFKLSQQLTKEQLQIRWQIPIDILHVLREHTQYKNCDASVFGSLSTGLADSQSNINVSIDIHGDNYRSLEEKSKGEQKKEISSFLRTAVAILAKASSPHDPTLKLYSKVQMGRRGINFIRLHEALTEIPVDITFGNRISVRKTKLLQFYMNFEPRARQLITFLRYWAKFHKISGPRKIKKYALALLVLVFLMQKRMLPSVLLLQAIAHLQGKEKHYGEVPYLIGQWDGSFSEDRDWICIYFQPVAANAPPLKPEEDTKMFFDLLTDFFETIATTKFDTSLVCPLLGQIVPNERLVQTASQCINATPAEVGDRWKEWHRSYFTHLRNVAFPGAPISIQDPFVLDFNMGGTCKPQIFSTFIAAAKNTLFTLKNNPSTFFELFVTPTRRHFEELASSANTFVPSDDDIQAQILLAKCSKRESHEDRMFRKKTSFLILKAIYGQKMAAETGLEHPVPSEALRLQMSWCFVEKYIIMLYRCCLVGTSWESDITTCQLKWQVTSLWRDFALEYLKRFFNVGLKLPEEKNIMKCAGCNAALNPADRWLDDDKRIQNKIDNCETRVHRDATVLQIRAMEANCKNIPVPTPQKKHQIYKAKVTYPFWKRRRLNHKANKCPLEEEGMLSLEIMEKFLNADEKMASDFTPFFLILLARIDARADEAGGFCGVSSVSIIVEDTRDKQLPKEVHQSQEHILARKCIMDIIQRTFEVYQSHQLSKWFKFAKRSMKTDLEKVVVF